MFLMDRAAIAALIPHAGAMCLLDGVLDWNATSLCGVSRRFADADNPLLRPDGTLGAASGIEIAAQAMALHARLLAGQGEKPAQGMLASLRNVRLATRQINKAAGELLIEAQLLLGDHTGATYRFALYQAGETLISGRATVLLRVPA